MQQLKFNKNTKANREILKKKDAVADELLTKKEIKDIIKKLNVGMEEFSYYLGYFLSYYEDRMFCKQCTNIEGCAKEIKGTILKLVRQEDGSLDKEVVKQNDMYWQYLNTPLSSVDFTQLLKQNKDTVGWLIVNNTNINYPVVQTTNNDYYLKHAFDRSKNYGGWVYADFRNDFEKLSKNTVIYAHGRKDGVMFGSLNNALKKNWYTNLENQIIQFSTLNYNTMWQVFSVYKVEAESYYITTDFSTDQAFEEFVTTMEERSIYDFGVDVSSEDKLLTLSTCFNDKGTRLVVQAKLVKIQSR